MLVSPARLGAGGGGGQLGAGRVGGAGKKEDVHSNLRAAGGSDGSPDAVSASQMRPSGPGGFFAAGAAAGGAGFSIPAKIARINEFGLAPSFELKTVFQTVTRRRGFEKLNQHATAWPTPRRWTTPRASREPRGACPSILG